MTEKLERLQARRVGIVRGPRKDVAAADTTPHSRYIPAPVRRVAHSRDKGRCAFVGTDGHRCRERHRLELHHEVPFGRGGSHAPENVRLLCQAHNRVCAERDYGLAVMTKYQYRRER